jgi:Gas vesicle protein
MTDVIGPGARDPWDEPHVAYRPIALIDLLDRLLAGGVVLAGNLTLRIADVDLVRVDLHALISTVGEDVPAPWTEWMEEP